MSFLVGNAVDARPIAYGDHVVIFQNPEALEVVRVKEGGVYQCRFGRYPHAALVGTKFGSRVRSADGGPGFVHVLQPTPELWTLALPHRTQILYHADIGFIVAQLDLAPGSVVVEAGTGSGSFSHSLVRTIAPNGRLHTFEYHATRAQVAKDEFVAHGLGDLVVIQHRDVCADGFGLDNVADAVFLDLPAPWEAITAAKRALKTGTATRICTFSPSIEQVQRSCDALRLNGFCEVRTFETLARPFEVRHAPALVTDVPLQTVKRQRTNDNASAAAVAGGAGAAKSIWAHPEREMRGHTSYLTFATLLPAPDAAVPATDPAAQPPADPAAQPAGAEATKETPSESEAVPVS